MITKYTWQLFYCLNLFLNYPNYLDFVKSKLTAINNGINNVKIAAAEFKKKSLWFLSVYLKWIPTPNEKLNELKSNNVKRISLKSRFEI